ncbi:MAG TPA: hypothetical protein VIE18_06190 [Gaiellaceae bacterium]|jgi:hypothetical protein
MNPNFRNAALIAAGLGLVVSLYFALSPGDDEAASTTTVATTTEPATTETTTQQKTTTAPPATTAPAGPVRITIDTANGEIVRRTVSQGREVVIVVRGPVTDEVHLHGYNLKSDVAPGEPAEIEFVASIPGQFEIELESRHKLLGVLEVGP